MDETFHGALHIFQSWDGCACYLEDVVPAHGTTPIFQETLRI